MNLNASNNRNSSVNSSLQAAAQAAAQINALLAADGKLQQQQLLIQNSNQVTPPSPTTSVIKSKDAKGKTSKKDLFSAEVEINDLPPRVRNLLTKGYIQEQIQWKSSKLCYLL